MNIKNIVTPLDDDIIKELKAGEKVFLSGYIYTARDTAHKRFMDVLNAGKALPFDITGPDYLLLRAITGASRKSHRGMRSHNKLANGFVYPEALVAWFKGDDRKREEITCRERSLETV